MNFDRYRVSKTETEPQPPGIALVEVRVDTPLTKRQLDHVARVLNETIKKEASFIEAEVVTMLIPLKQEV